MKLYFVLCTRKWMKGVHQETRECATESAVVSRSTGSSVGCPAFMSGVVDHH